MKRRTETTTPQTEAEVLLDQQTGRVLAAAKRGTGGRRASAGTAIQTATEIFHGQAAVAFAAADFVATVELLFELETLAASQEALCLERIR